MAITLPYPTNSSLLQFTAETVHNYSNHNTPHQRLLANDVALKAGIDEVQSDIASLESSITSLSSSSMKETYRNLSSASGSLFPASGGISPAIPWTISVPAGTYSQFYYLEVDFYLDARVLGRTWKAGVFVGPAPFNQKGFSASISPTTPSTPALAATTFTFIGSSHNDVDEDSRIQNTVSAKILYHGSWPASSRTFYVETVNQQALGWLMVRVFGV